MMMGNCISCARYESKGWRRWSYAEIVKKDTLWMRMRNSESYGNCIAESPMNNTLLYIGGGLIALAIGATLMKK